jgi:APA family basic amino acid/polyamine antiporter
MFSQIHTRFRTPFKSNLLFLLLISVFALFVPATVAGELTSIGTLLAFIIVSVGILVMRKKMPDAPRAFKTPWVPFVPLLGIAICLFMMVFLPFDTWIRLILWMLVGHNIYVFYGSKRSKLGPKKRSKLLSQIGLSIATLLLVMVVFHQTQIGWDSLSFMPVFLLTVAIGHIILYGVRLRK